MVPIPASNQAQEALRLASPPIEPDKWFDSLNWSDPGFSFLGQSFMTPVHNELKDRLTKAREWLLLQPQYSRFVSDEAALGRHLSIRDRHRGLRRGLSWHAFGLAVDLNYYSNAYVAGDRTLRGTHANENFIKALRAAVEWWNNSRMTPPITNAITLTSDTEGLDRHGHFLSELKDRYRSNTRDVFRALVQLNDAFRGYLESPEGSSHLRDLQAWPTDFWLGTSSNGEGPREPRNGFFILPEDLVVALRDHAGLAWGAVDLGPESGDFMHFDCRRISMAGQIAHGMGEYLRQQRQRAQQGQRRQPAPR